MATKYRVMPWPKNIYRPPKYISNAVDNLTTDELLVAGVKQIPLSAIVTGMYSHLGITISGKTLSLPTSITLPDDIGKYSSANIHGYSKKRRDLPKIKKSYELEGRNFQGDPVSNSYMREVYPIEDYAPLNTEIKIKLVHQEGSSGEIEYFIRFDVGRLLKKSDPDFPRLLIENLGLLREAVGIMGVFPVNVDDATVMMWWHMSWEILPPGTSIDELVNRAQGRAQLTQQERKELESRLKLLQELEPGGGFVAGTAGLSGYVGARFGDELTVLEHRNFGNAIYAIYKDWQVFSKMSRTEIRSSGKDDEFTRIKHTSNWVEKLQKLIQEKRSDL